jgi:hypothetical protein
MSSEHRVVRPYVGVEAVQTVLERVRLEFGERSLEPGQSVTTSSLHYLTDPLTLVFAPSQEEYDDYLSELTRAITRMGLATEQVELVLVLASPRLKIADVAWRVTVKEMEAGSPQVRLATAAERPPALRAPFGGCHASLYVVLAENLEAEPLRPTRRGTWLARCTYKVATDLGEIGFTPLELTDDVREEHGLGPRTVRFVDVDDPLLPGGADDALSVYVDSDVLARLAANTYTAGSRYFQRQLFLDAMTATIHRSSQALEHEDVSYTDGEDSLLGRLVRQMSRRGEQVDEEVAQSYWGMARDQPERLIGILESWLPEFKASLLDALGEEER